MDFLGVGDPRFGRILADSAEGSASLPEVDATRAAQRTGLEPLPYTRAEVEASSRFFPPGKAELLLGSEAREATLVEPGFLSRFRIVHFATHGLTDERFPMRSALVLSDPQDPSEDGFLAASEIYPLRLDAELVVLSACETGMGKMVRGEGVLGLPRALLFAGASNVVMSLWSVSDEATAELMTRFYEEMTDRKRPPAQALARAKVSMLESERWSHPFYWAGFVFLGPG
jgi:CHAT domain-containing protein